MDAELVISGIGVTSAIGQGRAAFSAALLRGEHAFKVMEREGRQRQSAFIGAEIASLVMPEDVPTRLLRGASLSGKVGLATLAEAWHDAALDDVEPERVGLVIGGSNFQQREQVCVHEEFASRARYVRPTYGMTFLDTDVCGLCTEQFRIRGFAHTIGAASASGQVAVLQAAQAVAAGQVDVCLAMGALMDLSHWECRALRSMGAMGSDRYHEQPHLACRPFDVSRDGFIYGECCAVLAIERLDTARRRGARAHARIAGWGTVLDGNRSPEPSAAGVTRAIALALRHAGLTATQIDYLNPHGTGSIAGDAAELQAIHACGLRHAWINTTKSITGHGLSAAGAVEIVATVSQMQARQLHPSRNLDEPIDAACKWVRDRPVAHRIRHALSLSAGFGGINTAICLSRASDD